MAGPVGYRGLNNRKGEDSEKLLGDYTDGDDDDDDPPLAL